MPRGYQQNHQIHTGDVGEFVFIRQCHVALLLSLYLIVLTFRGAQRILMGLQFQVVSPWMR